MFLWGHLVHHDQARETGLLSGQAALDAVLDTEAFKYALDGNGRSPAMTGAISSKEDLRFLPSTPAPVGNYDVIAHEYPGVLTQIMVYGLAGGVSAMRIAGQQHFTTDVLVGSALGSSSVAGVSRSLALQRRRSHQMGRL